MPFELPDPLRCFDGRAVTNTTHWRDIRRPEVLAAFAEHVFGRTPEIATRMQVEPRAPDAPVFDGLATRRQLRCRLLDGEDAPSIDLLLYLPAGATGPVPAILGLNYGNQGVSDDAGIVPLRFRGEAGRARPPLAAGNPPAARVRGGHVPRRRRGTGSARVRLPLHARRLEVRRAGGPSRPRGGASLPTTNGVPSEPGHGD